MARWHQLVVIVGTAVFLLWCGAALERALAKRQLRVIDLGETADGDRG